MDVVEYRNSVNGYVWTIFFTFYKYRVSSNWFIDLEGVICRSVEKIFFSSAAGRISIHFGNLGNHEFLYYLIKIARADELCWCRRDTALRGRLWSFDWYPYQPGQTSCLKTGPGYTCIVEEPAYYANALSTIDLKEKEAFKQLIREYKLKMSDTDTD